MAPAPLPPARRRRGTILLFTVMAAMLLLVGLGTTLAVARLVKDDAPDGTEMKVAWALPWSGDKAASLLNPLDATKEVWPAGDTVVRVQTDGIVALRVADGSVAWSYPIPEATSICTAGPHALDGVGLIAYGSDRICDTLAGIDLTTGKITFKTTIKAAKEAGPRLRESPTIATADNAAVVLSNSTIDAYRITDGAPLWHKRPPDRSCLFNSMTAGGDRVLISKSCLSTGLLAGADIVTSVDLATGKDLWNTPAKGTVQGLLSATPAIAYVFQPRPEDENATNFVAFDARGKVTARVPQTMDGGMRLDENRTSRGGGIGDDVFPVVTHHNVLYLRAENSPEYTVVAFDLATGTRKWASTGIDGWPCLIRADDEGVLVLETSYDGTRLMRINPTTGAATALTDGTDQKLDLPYGGFQTFQIDNTVIVAPYKRGTDSQKNALTALR